MARQRVVVDPRRGTYVADDTGEYETVIGHSIFPVGEEADGQYVLAMAANGSVFAIGPWLTQLGQDWDEAVSNLVLGRRGSRLPDI